MRHCLATIALPAVLLVAASALSAGDAFASSKGGYAYGFDNDRDDLAWAIVSQGHSSTSSLAERDDIEDLKSEIDGDFLYIRLEGDRYVIRDRSLIGRAQEAMKPIQEAAKELGKAVGARVVDAMNGSRESLDEARLIRRQARLQARIQRRADRDESTENLEAELGEVTRELKELSAEHRRHERSDRERGELARREETASRRMREATRHLNEEIRDILHDAKVRNLADPVRGTR
jgi:hypothetical protein